MRVFIILLMFVLAPNIGHSQSKADVNLDQLEESAGLDQAKTPKNKDTRANATNKSDSSSQLESTNKQLTVTQVPKVQNANEISYQRQISRIETQVNELKEEIYRSRGRLNMLKETVLASGLTGSEVEITLENRMGISFRLESFQYFFDGTPQGRKVDKDGNLDQRKVIPLITGPLISGNHAISVELIFRGNGYGVLTYINAYQFTLNDVYTFRAEEGKKVKIKVIAEERDGLLDIQDKPSLRFEQSIESLSDEAEASATAP